jgi:hypothetical protein
VASERSNIRAGVAVLASVAAGSALLWALIAWRASGRDSYAVRFTAAQGVYGLRPGAPFRVGGMARGEVTRIEPVIESGRVAGYLAHVEVDHDVPVTDRTRVEARAEDVSGDTVLVATIIDRTRPMAQSTASAGVAGRLPPGSEIRASDPDAFLTWSGPAGGERLRILYDAWFGMPARGKPLPAALKDAYVELERLSGPLRREGAALAEEAGQDFEVWRKRVAPLREEASAAIAKIGPGRDAAPDALLPALRDIGAQVRDMPAVETARAGRAGDALDRAIASVKGLRQRYGELQAMLADAETALGTTAADYSIATQEFSAGKREVMLSPWRLFGSPGAEDRERAARLGIVRAYAEAAVEHQRALKGVEDALRRDGPLLRTNPALAGLLRTRLDEANALFDLRAAAMEELLLGPAPARAAP